MAYGPGKVTASLGTATGAGLPELGFHYLTLIVFASTLLFASIAALTILPRRRRAHARRR